MLKDTHSIVLVMNKRKRKYEEEDEAEYPAQTSESKGPSVADFVSALKVDAFVRTFHCADDEFQADEVFDEARLRSYFQAYPRPLGDPLVLYLELLAAQGYTQVTGSMGELILCVTYK